MSIRCILIHVTLQLAIVANMDSKTVSRNAKQKKHSPIEMSSGCWLCSRRYFSITSILFFTVRRISFAMGNRMSSDGILLFGLLHGHDRSGISAMQSVQNRIFLYSNEMSRIFHRFMHDDGGNCCCSWMRWRSLSSWSLLDLSRFAERMNWAISSAISFVSSTGSPLEYESSPPSSIWAKLL